MQYKISYVKGKKQVAKEKKKKFIIKIDVYLWKRTD